MEKLLYVYWRRNEPGETLRRRFISEAKPRLVAAGAERLQINVDDFTDLSGRIENFKLQSMTPKPDGIVSFWLGSAYRAHPSREDERTEGFSQVSILQVPPRLELDVWRRIWFTQHTKIGIETQANFRYVQNVVVMPLEADLPPFRGIVEECFPSAALRDLR